MLNSAAKILLFFDIRKKKPKKGGIFSPFNGIFTVNSHIYPHNSEKLPPFLILVLMEVNLGVQLHYSGGFLRTKVLILI